MAAIVAVASGVGFVANRARQPLIVACIAAAIPVGRSVLDRVSDTEPIELFAEIGNAVLLFLVELKPVGTFAPGGTARRPPDWMLSTSAGRENAAPVADGSPQRPQSEPSTGQGLLHLHTNTDVGFAGVLGDRQFLGSEGVFTRS